MDQEAVYILNRRTYKESSLLLDVFCPNYGRLSLVANGAFSSKNSNAAMLQVFQPLLMIWTGKSSLKTLISVDAPSPSIPLQGRRLFSAYYLNELLIKLVPQDQLTNQHAQLFIHYANALNDLVRLDDIEIPLRVFEYQLLADLGVLPDLSHDIFGNLICSDTSYQYLPSQGFSPYSHNYIEQSTASGLCLAGDYLLKLSNLSADMCLEKEFRRTIKLFMRSLINDQLGGQVLKSRALFQTYQPFRSVR